MGDRRQNRKEIVNYVRLNYLIMTVGTGYLRKMFSQRWMEMGNRPWNEAHEGSSTTTLRNLIGDKNYKNNFDACQKLTMVKEKPETWDLYLISQILKQLDPELMPELQKLRNIWNTVSYSGTQSVTDAQFVDCWKSAVESFQALGMTDEELDSQLCYEQLQTKPPRSTFNFEDWRSFHKVMGGGMDLFDEMKYEEAKEVFTQILEKGGVTNNKLAKAYLFRSKCNFHLNLIDEAEDDGSNSLKLNPFSTTAYRWLASIHQEKGERLGDAVQLEKAIRCYESAVLFCKDRQQNKAMEAIKRNVRQKAEKIKRKEYLEPLLMEDKNKVQKNPVLQRMFPQYETLMEEFSPEASVLCNEASKYLEGALGYPQNYKKAAELFAAAARKGSPNGLYNMGYLLTEGKGVEKNLSEALEMYKKAAEMKNIEFCPFTGKDERNIGVAESQFALALAAQTGESPNIKEAIKWYQRALFNRYFPAATPLGQLYESGEGGLGKKLDLAVLTLSVGALNGSVRASESLVALYTNVESIPNAMLAYSWICYALELKSMIIPQDFINSVDRMITPNQKKSFDLKTFLAQVRSKLEASPFKSLLPAEGAEVQEVPFVAPENEGNDDATIKRIRHKKCFSKFWGTKLGVAKEEALAKATTPATNGDLATLKAVTFREMRKNVIANQDKKYDGKIIKLTVIEDAVLTPTAVYLLVKDEEGEIEAVLVYGYQEQGRKLQEAIGFGVRLSVTNPVFGLTDDGKMLRIKVDDLNTMIEHKEAKDKQMCRYCLKSGAKLVCVLCERAYYCDKVCMKKDKEEVKHEIVCRKIF